MSFGLSDFHPQKRNQNSAQEAENEGFTFYKKHRLGAVALLPTRCLSFFTCVVGWGNCGFMSA
jgi:hypothetical protein